MARPAFIEIDGKPYLWRDILSRRKEQLRAHAAAQQPPLFETQARPKTGIRANSNRPLPRADVVRRDRTLTASVSFM
jgi:hypothetical protein